MTYHTSISVPNDKKEVIERLEDEKNTSEYIVALVERDIMTKDPFYLRKKIKETEHELENLRELEKQLEAEGEQRELDMSNLISGERREFLEVAYKQFIATKGYFKTDRFEEWLDYPERRLKMSDIKITTEEVINWCIERYNGE